jgi:translation initiation factor IF-3
MLIGLDGEKIGILKTEEALTKARSLNMDLVQVSPKGNNPVVCKLLDYGKFKFEKKRIKLAQKNKRSKLQKRLNLDLLQILEITT